MKKLLIIPVFAALAGCQTLDCALRFVVEACFEKGINKSGEF